MSGEISTKEPMQRSESISEAVQQLIENRFAAPAHCDVVELEICPVTGKLDFSTLKISYEPDSYCIESKSLKYYLWAFKDYDGFCESLIDKIAQDIIEVIEPNWVNVRIEKNVGDGIALNAESILYKDELSDNYVNLV